MPILTVIAAAATIASPPLNVVVDRDNSGSFSIVDDEGSPWLRSAPVSLLGAALSPCPGSGGSGDVGGAAIRFSGKDKLGRFNSTQNAWCNAQETQPVMVTEVRKYSVADMADLSVTVFEQRFPQGWSGGGAGGQRGVSSAFPALQKPTQASAPASALISPTAPPLNCFTFWGPSGMFSELSRLWADGALSNTDDCASSSAGNAKGCDGMGPLTLYSNSSPPTALILSAGSEFLHHQMALAGGNNTSGGTPRIVAGVRGTVKLVPPNYTLSTLAVGGRGVTDTVRRWGRLLLRRFGKEKSRLGARPEPESSQESAGAATPQRGTLTAYDRDPSLRYLSYWTDAGAFYYKHTEPNVTGERTIQDVKKWMIGNKIPTRAYQLDSWWYPHDDTLPGGPLLKWEPIPTVMPDGFGSAWLDTPGGTGAPAVHSPLVMHSRAFSPKCVESAPIGGGYNRSWFILEDELALPIDADLFKLIMGKALRLGLQVYEQDWICLTASKMAATQENVVDARRWLAALDAGAAAHNLTLQLCMMFPRHVLHTVEMDSVTNARASTDYHPVDQAGCALGAPNPTCTQWNIGLTSLFYSALGIAPSKDNFRTSATKSQPREPNPLLQTLVAGLSGGPVGPSDQIGTMEFTTVHKICRGPDGYLNKPDLPLAPLDIAFNLGFEDAATGGLLGRGGLDSLPTLWSAYSVLGTYKFLYILAVDLKRPVHLGLNDLGLAGQNMPDKHITWEYFPECWRNQTAADRGTCEFELGAGHTAPFHANRTLELGLGGVRGDNNGSDNNATPFRYVLTAPVLKSGWVLLGETGKFFPATFDRFRNLTERDTGFSADVHGYANEGVIVEAFAPAIVRQILAQGGDANVNVSAQLDTTLGTVRARCGLSAAGRGRIECDIDTCCCNPVS